MPALRIRTEVGPEQLSFALGGSVADILRATPYPVRQPCGGRGRCGGCRVRVTEGTTGDLTATERRYLSSEQVRNGTRLACQLIPAADLTVEIIDQAVAWRELRDDEYAPVSPPSVPPVLSAVPAGLGVAVDLGTTEIRVTLWDTVRGRRLGGCTGPNPQSAFGADVLSRLGTASWTGEDAAIIGRVARDAIGDAIGYVLRRAHLDRSDVGRVVIVGNTAMLALLTECGYDALLEPDNWAREIDCPVPDAGAWVRSWGLPSGTRVVVARSLAGFVGSDLLADVLATGMTQRSAKTLLIDFGTNSEIAVWDGTTLWVTSTPGGPAFEGCGTDFGVPAEAGAVYRVRPLAGSDGFDCDAIGDQPPRGLCGSALVDVVACLVRDGRLKKTGNFAREIGDNGVVVVGGEPELVLRKRDVDAFQRAKAAIGAGTRCLLEEAGVPSSGLERVCVCGAFGRSLDVPNAQWVGLLPGGVCLERFEMWGNAALAGCELLLLAPEGVAALDRARSNARLVNLARVPMFDDRFVESLYLEPARETRMAEGEPA